MEYDCEADLIKRYKGLIKQVDCSISEKSVKKTSDLLKMMKKMVEDAEYLWFFSKGASVQVNDDYICLWVKLCIFRSDNRNRM